MTRACSLESRRERRIEGLQPALGGRYGKFLADSDTFMCEIGKLTEAARVEDTPQCRIGFPILSTVSDGVCLNILPFMTAEVLGHKKKPKLNIAWYKDRGNDVESGLWFKVFKGDRIYAHHLTLAEKRATAEKWEQKGNVTWAFGIRGTWSFTTKPAWAIRINHKSPSITANIVASTLTRWMSFAAIASSYTPTPAPCYSLGG